MLSASDKKAINACAKKYSARSVYLFGSSLGKGKANDIDLGVEGVEPLMFYKFYRDLMFALSKPVDLVDLSKKSKFNDLVIKDGVKVYG
jgi:predicted nucleotidyltransferase